MTTTEPTRYTELKARAKALGNELFRDGKLMYDGHDPRLRRCMATLYNAIFDLDLAIEARLVSKR